MPQRTSGGVFNQQVLTGSLSHYVVIGENFSGAIDQYGQPVPNSAAEIIFTKISEGAYINIMNPNEDNLSFALEEGRSVWDEVSLTEMIQGLGTDVGVDHIDCSICIVKRVPYIWGTGSSTSFLQLTDTPNSYAGAAGYVVTVNPGQTGLIFSPAEVTNAFNTITSPAQPDIVATGNDFLNFVAGDNISINLNSLTNTVTISSEYSVTSNYIPVLAGSQLSADRKYFITTAGTVTLPSLVGLDTGSAVHVTKSPGYTVFVNVFNILDIISTDLGDTDSIELDVTEEAIFIFNGTEWTLQIGSTN